MSKTKKKWPHLGTGKHNLKPAKTLEEAAPYFKWEERVKLDQIRRKQ